MLEPPEDTSGAAADDAPEGHPSRSQSRDAAHNAALDATAELLREDARSWARQLRTMADLAVLPSWAPKPLPRSSRSWRWAGSWSISQLTATRWQDEAQRFHTALPVTLALLETGAVFRHQAAVLLHRTRNCTDSVAQLAGWSAGMERLERRERHADRHAGMIGPPTSAEPTCSRRSRPWS